MFVTVLFFEKVEVLIIEGYAKKAEPLIFMSVLNLTVNPRHFCFKQL